MAYNFMKELGKEQVSSSPHTNSQSAIDLANNSVYYDRSKHIDVWVVPLHSYTFEGWCVVTGEYTHEVRILQIC